MTTLNDFIRKLAAGLGLDLAQGPLEIAFANAMQDPRTRPAFYSLLLESELYIGGQVMGGAPALDGTRELGPMSDLKLTFLDLRGEKVLPVFSSLERLRPVLGADANFLKLSGRDLLTQVAPKQAIALNPYTRHGREFDVRELEEIVREYV